MRPAAKRAIIVGCNGQDGRILFEQLTALGYALIGIARDRIRTAAVQWQSPIDILNVADIEKLVREFQPAEVYYLAALHHSSQQSTRLDPRQLFEASYQVHVGGLINFLQAMTMRCPQARLFYAASSHVFGNTPTSPQNEKTPLDPVCVYGITKTAGIQACRFYRKSHSLYASVGVFFNHESPYRPPNFVTQKIVRAALSIKRGHLDKLVLGDLSARVDWGWAADYVRAASQMLDLPEADDFVVATGQSHSVEEMVQVAFRELDLDWRTYVQEDSAILKKRRRSDLVGDSAKLKRSTGWQPSIPFAEMVSRLVQYAREHPVEGAP